MNKSPLICVLRAGGPNREPELALAKTTIRPYRIAVDSGENTWLHYHISDDDLHNGEELAAAIRKFLAENEKDLSALREIDGISHFELDIGLIIDDGMLSRSLTLDPITLSIMAAASITYTVSVYIASEGEP